jgi:hypothetical protein
MRSTTTTRPRQKLLWRHLWSWTLSALTLVWLTLMVVAWYTGHHETEELSDGHMVGVARLWLAVSPTEVGALSEPLARQGLRSYVQDVAVIEWQGDRVVTDTHRLAAGLDLSAAPAPGASVQHYEGVMGSGPWRMVVVEAEAATLAAGAPRRRVAVLMNMGQRVDLGGDVAEHVARPALLVLPLVALGLCGPFGAVCARWIVCPKRWQNSMRLRASGWGTSTAFANFPAPYRPSTRWWTRCRPGRNASARLRLTWPTSCAHRSRPSRCRRGLRRGIRRPSSWPT